MKYEARIRVSSLLLFLSENIFGRFFLGGGLSNFPSFSRGKLGRAKKILDVFLSAQKLFVFYSLTQMAIAWARNSCRKRNGQNLLISWAETHSPISIWKLHWVKTFFCLLYPQLYSELFLYLFGLRNFFFPKSPDLFWPPIRDQFHTQGTRIVWETETRPAFVKLSEQAPPLVKTKYQVHKTKHNPSKTH